MKAIRPWTILCALLLACPPARAADQAPPPLDTRGLAIEGIPFLKTWVAPDGGGLGGFAQVRFIVDEQGRVSRARVLDSSDPRLGDAALAAVRQWTFSPALSEGKPSACSMDVPVYFKPGAKTGKEAGAPPRDQMPQVSEVTPAAEKETSPGDYPDSLLSRSISGIVKFKCALSPQGKAVAIRVLFASHPDFVIPAVEAIQHWEYTPAMQGDLPVASEIAGALTFKPSSGGVAEVLSENSIAVEGVSDPKNLPDIEIIADPVIPYDEAIKGVGGSASVAFTIDEEGHAVDVRVQSATAPAFGKALAAAVEASVFSSASDGTKPVRVQATRRADFPALATDSTDPSDPMQRVLAAVRSNQVKGAQGLDGKLVPIYRVAPEFPESAKARGIAAGHADIEFIIDRDGRARLPRVSGASDEAFGWSALTAVSQWVFKAPTRAGQPTDVRVKVPFDFRLPAGA